MDQIFLDQIFWIKIFLNKMYSFLFLQEHTPALQTFREGALEKRTEVLAQEELKVRGQLDSELSILRGKLDQETRKAVDLQRMRMIDEHRRRSEDLTAELLQRHEKKLR